MRWVTSRRHVERISSLRIGRKRSYWWIDTLRRRSSADIFIIQESGSCGRMNRLRFMPPLLTSTRRCLSAGNILFPAIKSKTTIPFSGSSKAWSSTGSASLSLKRNFTGNGSWDWKISFTDTVLTWGSSLLWSRNYLMSTWTCSGIKSSQRLDTFPWRTNSDYSLSRNFIF